jgi:hypothetical protein
MAIPAEVAHRALRVAHGTEDGDPCLAPHSKPPRIRRQTPASIGLAASPSSVSALCGRCGICHSVGPPYQSSQCIRHRWPASKQPFSRPLTVTQPSEPPSLAGFSPFRYDDGFEKGLPPRWTYLYRPAERGFGRRMIIPDPAHPWAVGFFPWPGPAFGSAPARWWSSPAQLECCPGFSPSYNSTSENRSCNRARCPRVLGRRQGASQVCF